MLAVRGKEECVDDTFESLCCGGGGIGDVPFLGAVPVWGREDGHWKRHAVLVEVHDLALILGVLDPVLCTPPSVELTRSKANVHYEGLFCFLVREIACYTHRNVVGDNHGGSATFRIEELSWEVFDAGRTDDMH